jgi:hypothetical protein
MKKRTTKMKRRRRRTTSNYAPGLRHTVTSTINDLEKFVPLRRCWYAGKANFDHLLFVLLGTVKWRVSKTVTGIQALEFWRVRSWLWIPLCKKAQNKQMDR